MSIYDTLITDRTSADVGRTAKGKYDYEDLNRVTAAMDDIARRFAECGYYTGYSPVQIIHLDGSTDTVWRENDEDIRETQLGKYLSNVRTLRSVLSVLSNTPETPADMDKLTYQEANAIEQILIDVNVIINRIIASFRRCGQFTGICGVLPLPSEGWNRGRTWEELDALGWGWDVWDTLTWDQLLYGEV